MQTMNTRVLSGQAGTALGRASGRPQTADAVSHSKRNAVKRSSVEKRRIKDLGYNAGEDIEAVQKAANGGIASEQFRLGLLCQRGLGGLGDKSFNEASGWFRRAADQGHARALRSIMLENKKRTDKRFDFEGQDFMQVKDLAMKDNPFAQSALGMMYEEGIEVRQSDANAIEWYMKAANQDHADAEFNLALMYQDGKGVDQNDETAAQWLMKAAEHGQAMAQNAMGLAYKKGHHVEQDDGVAVEWFAKAAEQGLADAQCNLGSMYLKGLGVEQSDTRAMYFFRKAATQLHARAHMKIGWLYEHGVGVPQDLKKAGSWIHRMAEQSYAPAQYKLASWYEEGKGFNRKDEKMAVLWYKKAAEQGHRAAQNHLGVMYELGRGVDQSDEDAAKWYKKGAEKGHPDACHNIGLLYQAGWGVKKNDTEAIVWHAKAAQQGHEVAEQALRIVAEKKFQKKTANMDLQSLLILASSVEVGKRMTKEANKRKSSRKSNNEQKFSFEDTLPEKIVKDCIMSDAIMEKVAHCLVTKLSCFGLDVGQAKQLAQEMNLFRFSTRDFVLQEGETGNYFFIIQDGKFHVSKDGSVVATLGPDTGFGEIALVHNCPRTASVLAATDDASCWGVTRASFRHHLEQCQKNSYEDNRYFVDSVRLLDGLTKPHKDKLTQLAVLTQVFDAEQTIVTEGQEGRCMYIVKSGQCGVVVGGTLNPKTLLIEGGKEVVRVKEGQCFGERALIYGEPRAASVKASVKSELLCLDHALLYKVLGGELDSLLRQNVINYALKESAIFKRFSYTQQMQLGENMEFFSVEPDQAVQKPLRFFVVVEGMLKENTDSVTITNGQCWGDENMRDINSPVDSSFVAGPKGAVLASLTSQNLKLALRKSGFKEGTTVEDVWDLNLKAEVASKHWIFQHLSLKKLRGLTEVMESQILKKGVQVVTQGDAGTKFFIVASGQLKTIVEGRKVFLTENDCFGERALLAGDKWKATVEVSSEMAQVWVLDRTHFQGLIDRYLMIQLAKELELQNENIEFEELTRKNMVSNGTFGIVKYVKTKSNFFYALKCIKNQMIDKHGKEDCLQTEVELLNEMRHPFIIRLVKTFPSTPAWSYKLLEAVTGGHLMAAVEKKLAPAQAKFYFGSIFLALEYLHFRHVLYRNCNADHILLDSQGYPKLIDFANAKRLTQASGRTKSTVGVAHYMSPEVIQGKLYGVGADYWALGVVLYFLLVGELPFGNGLTDQMQIFTQVVNAKEYTMTALGNDAGENLCRGLLEPQIEQRVASGLFHPIQGCLDIRRSEWFQESSENDDGSIHEGYLDRLLTRQENPPIRVEGNALERMKKIAADDNFEEEDQTDDQEDPLSPKQ